MKNLYEAANSAEAHMLQHLLQQQGIEAIVQGDYLQGGLGDLPMSGFIRLMVADEQYDEARQVIAQWESSNPRAAPASAAAAVPVSRSAVGLALAIALSFLAGIAVSWMYFDFPIASEGLDYNDDGELDEHWYWAASGHAQSAEYDRNFDGKIDSRFHLDRQGRTRSGEEDSDFNGYFETTWAFSNGLTTAIESDTDADGRADIVTRFEHGVPVLAELLNPELGIVVRRQHLHFGKLVTEEVDTNSDGIMDVINHYDGYGAIVKVTPVAAAVGQ